MEITHCQPGDYARRTASLMQFVAKYRVMSTKLPGACAAQPPRRRTGGHGWSRGNLRNLFAEAQAHHQARREPRPEQLFGSQNLESQDSVDPSDATKVLRELDAWVGAAAEMPEFEVDSNPWEVARDSEEDQSDSHQLEGEPGPCETGVTQACASGPGPPPEVGATGDTPAARHTRCIALERGAKAKMAATDTATDTNRRTIHLPSQAVSQGDSRLAGSYASCKVAQLVKMCSDRGLTTKNKRKAVLVELLQQHDHELGL